MENLVASQFPWTWHKIWNACELLHLEFRTWNIYSRMHWSRQTRSPEDSYWCFERQGLSHVSLPFFNQRSPIGDLHFRLTIEKMTPRNVLTLLLSYTSEKVYCQKVIKKTTRKSKGSPPNVVACIPYHLVVAHNSPRVNGKQERRNNSLCP